ncbi:MAG: fibronectin type III domain-containing protein [Eubacterium sp.]|nr:fibronectin type III domain-containing protein [Eubacterium sp.]
MKVGKRALSFLLSLMMLVSIALSAPIDVFADQPYFLGVDVSEHNRNVDFKALKKKGYDFAMIRVGYVTRKGEFIDKLFYEHIKGACEAGMFFGLYLYSYACDSDRVKQEANFTIKTIKTIDSKYLKNMTLPVAYDVEDKTIIDAGCKMKQITDHTVQYCSAIKKAGYKPMVYTNLNWFNHYVDINQITSNNIRIWYANWVNHPDFSTVKTIGDTGIESYMWQYQSGSYANDGIKLDKNVLYPALDYAEITLSKTAYTYSGTARKPSVTVKIGSRTLKKDTDYTVAYSNNINAGTATVTIKGKGNYKGSVKKKFTIKPKAVESDAKLILEKSSYVYDGTAKKPAVTVQLSNGNEIDRSNYTVKYSNNTDIGAADVKVTFKENYSGSVSEVFKIKPKGTSVLSVSSKYKGFTVKWEQQTTQTTGYQIQYSTSSTFTDAQKLTISENTITSQTITDLEENKNYFVRVRTFKLVDGTRYCSSWSPAESVITYSRPNSISLSETSYVYDGSIKTPTVIVKNNGKLVDSEYYTVSYENGRKNVGKYTVTIKFKAPYSGTIQKTFMIKPKETTLSGVSAKLKGFTVKWKKQTTQTTGYQIQYSTDQSFSKNYKTITVSGNSTVSQTITGLTAKKKYYVRIRTYKLVDGTRYCSAWSPAESVITYSQPNSVSLSATSCTYNGKVKKPKVTVKDNGKVVDSKYYTVSYQSGRKNVGKYTVTIKFKAPYGGTVKKTFTIKPKATTLSSVIAKSKGFTAKWKKQSTQTTGYQIQYSTSSKFTNAKTVTVSKNKTTSKSVSKLKAKKKYYVRVRTYKTVKVNGKSTKIYSSWSKSKSVKTK